MVQGEVGPGSDVCNVCRERCLSDVKEPMAVTERVLRVEGRFLRPEDLAELRRCHPRMSKLLGEPVETGPAVS